jgi:hypothetical protein
LAEYFKLQLKLSSRTFEDYGINPWAGFLLLIGGFVGFSAYMFYKTEFAPYIYIFTAFSLITRMNDIKRVDFVKAVFPHDQYLKIRIIENLLIALPFILFLLFRSFYIFPGGLLLLSILMALTSFSTGFNIVIPTPFSRHPFEFTVGFRNTFLLIIVAYILIAIAISVDNYNLGFFSFLLVFMTTYSYYFKSENEFFVWSFSTDVRVFLFQKIKTAVLYSTILCLPIIIALSIFKPENTGLMLIFLLTGYAFLITIILAKYSAYPNEISFIHGIMIALSIYFPPILIIVIPIFFKQSVKRLYNYLA